MDNTEKLIEPTTAQLINEELLNACIHCGLCLPACPTYLATGRELESPRGRIYLLNLWQHDKASFSPRMAEHLDSCLGCYGCQTACPSGVKYEAIFNQAKIQINTRTPIWSKLPKYLAFKWLLPNENLLQNFGKILKIWQTSGSQNIIHSLLSRLNSLYRLPLAVEMQRWLSLLPEIPEHKQLPRLVLGTGKQTNIVQFFKGCVMDVMYNQVNIDSLELIKQSSQLVAVPNQTCCGALACHSGEKELAKQLAKSNIENYSATEGPIVATASGCTAMLKTYPELFSGDDPWHERARAFSARVQDLPEFLAQNQLNSPSGSYISDNAKPITIAYHAACHLAHAQGIRTEPKQLLENFAQAVNNLTGQQTITLVPLIEEEYCCGSAGIYNLGHPDLSEKILLRKVEQIKMSGADIIVTTNPGCILQIQAGIGAQRLNVQVLHLATLMAKAYLKSF